MLSMSLENKITRPEVPYGALIPGGVFAGRAILIRGLVNENSERFNIDLCCGHLLQGDHRDDKALHFNARFDHKGAWPFGKADNDIVLNSLINNGWGLEHRCTNTLEVGKQFVLRLLVLRDYYKLTLNGKFLCDFVHRLPLSRIKVIYIDGCIRVDEIEYQGTPQLDEAPMASRGDHFEEKSFYKPNVPFVLPFTGFVSPRRLNITGTPRMSASRFEINFMIGTEFLLHFRVDLPSKTDVHGAVVRNSTKNSQWQDEERDVPTFPFKLGHTFDIVFIAQEHCVEVVVDGLAFAIFRYRNHSHPSEVTSVSINGDILLQNVQLM